jgi:hypothetical protein
VFEDFFALGLKLLVKGKIPDQLDFSRIMLSYLSHGKRVIELRVRAYHRDKGDSTRILKKTWAQACRRNMFVMLMDIEKTGRIWSVWKSTGLPRLCWLRNILPESTDLGISNIDCHP